MNQRLIQPYERNPLLLKSLVVEEDLYSCIDQIAARCTQLTSLTIGKQSSIRNNPDGSIWDGARSINGQSISIPDEQESDEDTRDNDDNEYDLDVKMISCNLHDLRILEIGTGLQMKRQPVAPATLEELTLLEEIRMCPIRDGVLCDQSRDEWNLRVLAQSSKELRKADLRGCYLKILSLGWLETEILESLHLYYQVPAASVLSKWSKNLKYITLAKISRKYRAYRSMGPVDPGEELDACLLCLAVPESQLKQIDLQESDCSLKPLQGLVAAAKDLSYIDTRGCNELPHKFRIQLTDRERILEIF